MTLREDTTRSAVTGEYIGLCKTCRIGAGITDVIESKTIREDEESGPDEHYDDNE